jgi:hypothetical protein
VCGAAYDAFSKCLYKSMEHKRGGFMMPDGGCGDEYLAGFKFKKVEIPRALMKENIKTAEAMEKKREKALEIEAKLEARERGEPEAPADPTTCLKDVVLCIHETKNQKLDKAVIKQKARESPCLLYQPRVCAFPVRDYFGKTVPGREDFF